MTHPFCPGYPAPYAALVASYPGTDIYPAAAFRVEWGPIFHRGRLDGSTRLLVIGQDPAAEEDITRRILVGVAGQRTQGLLTRLGIVRSYTMINTFLYSVASQSGGSRHQHDAGIVGYRNQWLDQLRADNPIEAVITLGTLAAQAYQTWTATLPAAAHAPYHAELLHPTYPESAAAKGQVTLAAATAKLLANWNANLTGLGAALQHPDEPASLTPYGSSFTAADLTAIPEADLPPGLPGWMRSTEVWANRVGATADDKRATVVAEVPADLRPWGARG
jgi:uracil-DNA glycosylase